MKKLPIWRRPWAAKKILEIGGGHDPYEGVTHSVEKYPQDNSQRGGDLQLPHGAKLFQGDLESLPFSTDEKFDFLYASHVFEHVNDPQKAVNEINRVASRGYIETPSPLRDQLSCPVPFDAGNDFHTYFCWSSKNTIHVIKKDAETVAQFPNNFSGNFAKKLFQLVREEKIDLEPLMPRKAKTTKLFFSGEIKIRQHKNFHEAAAAGFCAYEDSINQILFHVKFPVVLAVPRLGDLRKMLKKHSLI